LIHCISPGNEYKILLDVPLPISLLSIKVEGEDDVISFVREEGPLAIINHQQHVERNEVKEVEGSSNRLD